MLNDSELNSNAQSTLETFCNNVAAELLVPESLIKKEWIANNKDLITKVKDLAIHFNVSRQVIVFRAANLYLISDLEKNHLLKLINSNPTNTVINDDGDRTETIFIPYTSRQKARMDKNFLRALKKSVEDGSTSYTEAMHLTNSGGTNFFELLEKVN